MKKNRVNVLLLASDAFLVKRCVELADSDSWGNGYSSPIDKFRFNVARRYFGRVLELFEAIYVDSNDLIRSINFSFSPDYWEMICWSIELAERYLTDFKTKPSTTYGEQFNQITLERLRAIRCFIRESCDYYSFGGNNAKTND